MRNLEPVPSVVPDLRSWANKIVSYLRSLERAAKDPAPRITHLEHVLDLSTASAVQDGVLVWSTEHSCPAVSYNGHWYKVTTVLIP